MELSHSFLSGGMNKLNNRMPHKPPRVENKRTPFPEGNLNISFMHIKSAHLLTIKDFAFWKGFYLPKGEVSLIE